MTDLPSLQRVIHKRKRLHNTNEPQPKRRRLSNIKKSPVVMKMNHRAMRIDEMLPCLNKVSHVRNGMRFTSKDQMITTAMECGLLSFSHDFNVGGGSKYYHVFTSIGVLEYATHVSKETLCLHEVIMDGRLTKLVMDIECDETANPTLAFPKVLKYIVEMLVVFYNKVHNVIDVQSSDFLILTACRPGKYSAHIVQGRGVVFENPRTLFGFLAQFEYWLVRKETTELCNGIRMVDGDRVSVIVADSKSILVPTPTSSLSFSSTDEEVEEEENELRFAPFTTLFDWHPISSHNGSLRTYYSTKPGHSRDEQYRLKKTSITESGEFILDREFSPDFLLLTLTQAVFSTYSRNGSDELKETIVMSSIPELNEWDRYSNNVWKKIVEYTYFYFKRHSGGLVRAPGYATIEDLQVVWGTERASFVPGLISLIRGTHKPNGESCGSSNGRDYACCINLPKFNYPTVFAACEMVLESYKKHAQYRYPTLYGKGEPLTQMVGVKINRQATALCLTVKNLLCEIVRDDNSGNGHGHPSQNTWLKVIIPNGTITQRCHKNRCAGKRSREGLIDTDAMRELRVSLDHSVRVHEIINKVDDELF